MGEKVVMREISSMIMDEKEKWQRMKFLNCEKKKQFTGIKLYIYETNMTTMYDEDYGVNETKISFNLRLHLLLLLHQLAPLSWQLHNIT